MFDTKIINLHSGPGSGKSTTAAGLFFLMKLNGIEAELTVEHAKELTWDGEIEYLRTHQKEVFLEQKRRIDRLIGKVQYVITDSPLLLSMAYGHPNPAEVMATFETYNNLNFFINRVKPYNPNGRNQDEQGAQELDKIIEGYLKPYPYTKIDGDKHAPEKILFYLNE